MTERCTCGTCRTCLTQEHNILETIRETINGVPNTFNHLVGIQAINYDKDLIHHGTQPERLPHGLDRTIDDWEQGIHGIQTRDGIQHVIQSWANAWADQRNDTPTSTRTPITYLQNNLQWAATHPNQTGWNDYRQEIRATLTRINQLTDTPNHQNAGANCLYCGHDLTNNWTPNGLSDHITCTQCRRHYTPRSLTLAARQMIHDAPHTNPNAHITLDDAKTIFPDQRPKLTMWAHRARKGDSTPITPQGKNRHGKHTYRLGDITAALQPQTTNA